MKKTLVLTLLMAVAAPSIADHLPESLLAHGKPENTLAGINLEKTTLDQALQKYGPPVREVNVPNNPDWTGYLWQIGGLRLEVEAVHSAKKVYIDRVSIVRTGTIDTVSEVSSTGAGLKLGDGLSTLRRIYGTKFQLSKQQAVPPDTEPFLSVPGSQTAMIQWTPVEFTLIVGLDAQSNIIAMQLSLPECYPGGCR